MKFCKDCKYYHPSMNDTPRCLHIKALKINPVDGKSSQLYCETMRFGGECGLESAQFYEPAVPAEPTKRPYNDD